MRSVLFSYGTETRHQRAHIWEENNREGRAGGALIQISSVTITHNNIWAHLTNLSLARSLALSLSQSHSLASRWTAGCGASRGTTSAPDTPKQLTRRLTDKHDDTNTTRGFKIRAVEEQALVPSTLVTAEWLSDSEEEDTVLAVWRKEKVRDCHLTEGSFCQYQTHLRLSHTGSLTFSRVFFFSWGDSSVINGDNWIAARDVNALGVGH